MKEMKNVRISIYQITELINLIEEKMCSLDSNDIDDNEYWCYLNNILTILEFCRGDINGKV